MKLKYFDFYSDNLVGALTGVFTIDDGGEVYPPIDNVDRVTGFKFCYINDEFDDNEYVKMIFIGKVLDFEHVKHLIASEYYDEYKDYKFIVSFDSDGNIFDMRPINDKIENEVVAVSDRNELLKAYKDETGFDFVSSHSKK